MWQNEPFITSHTRMYIFYHQIIYYLNMIEVFFTPHCSKEVFRLTNIFIRCFWVEFWKLLFLPWVYMNCTGSLALPAQWTTNCILLGLTISRLWYGGMVHTRWVYNINFHSYIFHSYNLVSIIIDQCFSIERDG